jgi:hypothetical protein
VDVMRSQYRPLSDVEQQQLRELKAKALELHGLISALGASRELSLALTKLEECVMWSVKALTR